MAAIRKLNYSIDWSKLPASGTELTPKELFALLPLIGNQSEIQKKDENVTLFRIHSFAGMDDLAEKFGDYESNADNFGPIFAAGHFDQDLVYITDYWFGICYTATQKYQIIYGVA